MSDSSPEHIIFSERSAEIIRNKYPEDRRLSDDQKKHKAIFIGDGKFAAIFRNQISKWVKSFKPIIDDQVMSDLLAVDNWYTTINEFFAGYCLSRMGAKDIQWRPEISDKTPDFLFRHDKSNRMYILEVLTLNPPQQRRRTHISDSKRILAKIDKKRKAYKDIVPVYGLIIGVLPDFGSCYDDEDFLNAIPDNYFTDKDYLSGLMYLDYQTNNIERVISIANQKARIASSLEEGLLLFEDIHGNKL